MRPAGVAEKENELFEELKKYNGNSCGFVRDGVIGPEYWHKKPRILFLLKEVHGDETFWNGKRTLPSFLIEEGGRGNTWNNIVRWTRVLRDSTADWSDSEHISEADRRKELARIASVNIKKTPGESVSRRQEIMAFAEKYAGLLKRQIQLYEPDIVLCGRTGDEAATILFSGEPEKVRWEKSESGPGYFFYKKILVLDFYHPGCRGRTKQSFDALKRVFNEIRNKHPSKLNGHRV